MTDSSVHPNAYTRYLLDALQREAAAAQALKEAEEKRKRDEEAAEQARLTAERTAALQVTICCTWSPVDRAQAAPLVQRCLSRDTLVTDGVAPARRESHQPRLPLVRGLRGSKTLPCSTSEVLCKI